MEILSEIFLVTFSILYGIMLNGILGLSIFPFGRLFGFPTSAPKFRIVVSFIIINLVPFAIFSWVLPKIETIQGILNFGSAFGVFLMSMIVFAPYRVLQVLISNGWAFRRLYGCLLETNVEGLPKDRIARIRSVRYSSTKGHLFAFVFYSVLFVIGWFFVFYLFPCTRDPL